MKERILVGAQASIADGIAKLWARRGDHITLIDEDGEKLATLAKDLQARGATKVEVSLMKLGDPEKLTRLTTELLAEKIRVDTLLVAIPLRETGEERGDLTGFERVWREVALSTCAVLLAAKTHFENNRHGTLAALYNWEAHFPGPRWAARHAAQAAVHSVLGSLRQELRPSDVRVCSLIAGPLILDQALKKQIPYGRRPELIALEMATRLEKEDVVFAPSVWRWLIAARQLWPDRFRSLNQITSPTIKAST